MGQPKKQDYFLDISEELCPMTFVRVKLLIERMKPGEVAEIRLSSGEPLENVPRSIEELGHLILHTQVEDEAAEQPLHRLWLKKG